MGAFRGLPRVLRLVWDVQPFYTGALGALNIAQGLVPAATAWVSAQLINSVVAAITHQGGDGTTTLVIWFVVAQFAIQAVSSLLSTIANIYQQLLQEKVAVDVQLKVMEKANTLDLGFFEDATFYDSAPAGAARGGLASHRHDLADLRPGPHHRHAASRCFAMLVHLAWWLAIVALIAPLPVFIANVRYGWWGYQMMRRQSPLRREMSYYNTLLTTDTYNKEIKLFTLGDFFIRLYRTLSVSLLRRGARARSCRATWPSFGWGLLAA